MSWGNPETLSEHLRAAVLKPFAHLYGLGNSMHRLLYQNVIKPKNISIPVISIGNLTCGGTGKTPIVIFIARYLIANRFKVAVVSRGYRKRAGASVAIVSDGQGNFADCQDAGDEPLLIAMSVPDSVVISGTNRIEGCTLAVEKFGCDIIVLDDGFQHYPLHREIDIVLLDYADDVRRDSLLPAGRLREPAEQLKRAGQVVITKLPANVDQSRLRQLKATAINLAPHASVSTCRFVANGVTPIPFGPIAPLNTLKSHSVIAFCGLARPEGFFSLLKEQGIKVTCEKQFPDHHWYTSQDLNDLRKLKEVHKASMLVTTQKDAVKLSTLGKTDDILALVIETEWLEGVPTAVKDFVTDRLRNSGTSLATNRMQIPIRI